MGALLLILTFVVPVAFVLLLEKERYKAAGCLMTVAGALWACLWSHDPGDAPLMTPIGYLAVVVGALVYLHGVKRDILSYLDDMRQDLFKAIERAAADKPKGD